MEVEPITVAERRLTAYHEAGHCVAHWLFGTLGDLVHASMQPDDINLAHVRSRGSLAAAPDTVAALKNACPAAAKLVAARSIFHCLIGPGAQDRAGDEPADDWLADLNAESTANCRDATDDFGSAMHIAHALLGTTHRRVLLVRRVAGWVDECLTIPRVWSVVTAVGDQLATRDFLEGEEACAIMAAAWGPDQRNVPITAMGVKWKRRLFSM